MSGICFKVSEKIIIKGTGKAYFVNQDDWYTEVYNSILFTFMNVYKVQHIILRKQKRSLYGFNKINKLLLRPRGGIKKGKAGCHTCQL